MCIRDSCGELHSLHRRRCCERFSRAERRLCCVCEMSRRRSNIRLLIFVVGLILAFSLLLSRAYYLQITTASEYRTRATEQAVDTYDVTGRRGVIYDRDGGELAVSIRTATIWADPQRVEDPEGAALALAPVPRPMLLLPDPQHAVGRPISWQCEWKPPTPHRRGRK